jgi:hypothetical protein
MILPTHFVAASRSLVQMAIFFILERSNRHARYGANFRNPLVVHRLHLRLPGRDANTSPT